MTPHLDCISSVYSETTALRDGVHGIPDRAFAESTGSTSRGPASSFSLAVLVDSKFVAVGWYPERSPAVEFIYSLR